MKRTLRYLSSILFLFFFSCETEDVEVKQNNSGYLHLVDYYESMYSETLLGIDPAMVSVKGKNIVRIEVEEIQKAVQKHLSEEHFNGATYSYADIPLARIISASTITRTKGGKV